MKRVGNLYEEIVSSENLFLAYKESKKGKRNKKAVLDFELNFGREMSKILKALQDGSYKPSPYKEFTIYEPKQRTIYAPTYADVVVQHAIYRAIYPIFEKRFISQSHGCRKGYGVQSASDYLQNALRQTDEQKYFLQLDIRKYFYSFDRNKLRVMLQRVIKDKKVIELLMLFAEYEQPKGVPIGNLLSQLFGLIYLNPLDHFVKRELRVKKYVRYVDDFILVDLELEEAKELLEKIEMFLHVELGLSLSKVTIAKVKRGVNFVGYRTWRTHKLVRKFAICKFKSACKKQKVESLISMVAHAKDTKTLKYYKNLLKEFEMLEKMPKKIQRRVDEVL